MIDQSNRNCHPRCVLLAKCFLVILAIYGGFRLVFDLRELLGPGGWIRQTIHEWRMPKSILPGPARTEEMTFELDQGNAMLMQGMDSEDNERWRDVADQAYAKAFIDRFSYEGESAEVWLQIQEQGKTLTGRIEARGLKPNFAYQIKLNGVYKHKTSFERIGYTGRWRLPGGGTNFTDAQYEAFADKQLAQSYLFFDYFITDKHGNGVRNLSLDSSLHVLWSATRQRGKNVPEENMVCVQVKASDPAVYAQPTDELVDQCLWAERELWRYSEADQVIRLPQGEYKAELVLTEESFHAEDAGGGFWATVMKAPVCFVITASPANP